MLLARTYYMRSTQSIFDFRSILFSVFLWNFSPEDDGTFEELLRACAYASCILWWDPGGQFPMDSSCLPLIWLIMFHVGAKSQWRIEWKFVGCFPKGCVSALPAYNVGYRNTHAYRCMYVFTKHAHVLYTYIHIWRWQLILFGCRYEALKSIDALVIK